MARVAKGFREARKIMLAVRFSPETFEELCALAAKHHTSLGEQVRELVEIGLEVEAVADLVEITSK
jgi:plasmid stability protein